MVAVGILMYLQMVLDSIYLGYNRSVSAIIGYNYGAKNQKQLKFVIGTSVKFSFLYAFLCFLGAFLFTDNIISIFINVDGGAFDTVRDALTVLAFAFLFQAFNAFVSAQYTAFSNGKISALLSFLRTFFFFALFLAILPPLFGAMGIWFTMLLTEACTFIVSLYFYLRGKKQYGY